MSIQSTPLQTAVTNTVINFLPDRQAAEIVAQFYWGPDPDADHVLDVPPNTTILKLWNSIDSIQNQKNHPLCKRIELIYMGWIYEAWQLPNTLQEHLSWCSKISIYINCISYNDECGIIN